MPMLPVPVPTLTSFEAILEKRAIAPIQRGDYKKWLRYFLDFCTKYPVPGQTIGGRSFLSNLTVLL